MDEKRCAFCDKTEAEAEGGRLYEWDVRPDHAPPRAPTCICADCSEQISLMVRMDRAYEGKKVSATDERFPVIASHRFQLRGPNGEESEAFAAISAPYVVDEHTARCPVSITGPMPMLQEHVGGVDTLQALCLAMDVPWWTLKQLEREGWRWVGETGSHDLDIMFARKIIGRDPPERRGK
jgi:hypothetical protein